MSQEDEVLKNEIVSQTEKRELEIEKWQEELKVDKVEKRLGLSQDVWKESSEEMKSWTLYRGRESVKRILENCSRSLVTVVTERLKWGSEFCCSVTEVAYYSVENSRREILFSWNEGADERKWRKVNDWSIFEEKEELKQRQLFLVNSFTSTSQLNQ
jgi:hypothetical protein